MKIIIIQYASIKSHIRRQLDRRVGEKIDQKKCNNKNWSHRQRLKKYTALCIVQENWAMVTAAFWIRMCVSSSRICAEHRCASVYVCGNGSGYNEIYRRGDGVVTESVVRVLFSALSFKTSDACPIQCNSKHNINSEAFSLLTCPKSFAASRQSPELAPIAIPSH